MGLDMHMYKVDKISKSFCNEFRSSIPYRRYCHLEDNSNIRFYTAEHSESLFKFISDESKKRFFVPVKINMCYVNIYKMMQDKYGKDLPRNLVLSSRSYQSDCIKEVYRTIDRNKEYELILTEDNQKQYIFYKDTDHIAVECSEVAYWRKNYWLDRYIQECILKIDVHDDILNCCYAEITKDNLKDILSSMKQLLLGKDIGSSYKLPYKDDKEYKYACMYVEDAISQISDVLKTTNFQQEMILYHPWW